MNSDDDQDGGIYVVAYLVLQLFFGLCFGCGLLAAIGIHLTGG